MKDLSEVIPRRAGDRLQQLIDDVHNADLSKEEIAILLDNLESMLGRMLVDEMMGRR